MYKPTARKEYINILTELIKEESPVLYLEDFLYYYNKGIGEYLNARYEKFELTQQITDDVRTWKHKYTATPTEVEELEVKIDNIKECRQVTLSKEIIITPPVGPPMAHKVNYTATKCDKGYRHLLNCVVEVKLLRPVSHCTQAALTTKKYKVTRSTSDRNAVLPENDYLKATFYRPYFSISGDSILIDVGDIDKKKAKISSITLEYLTQPDQVNLTEAEIEDPDDKSQDLGFSEDVAGEIRKRVMLLILERNRDPRMVSNQQVGKSVNDIGAISVGGKK